jgi:predicted RNase H-like HicB family nuclease
MASTETSSVGAGRVGKVAFSAESRLHRDKLGRGQRILCVPRKPEPVAVQIPTHEAKTPRLLDLNRATAASFCQVCAAEILKDMRKWIGWIQEVPGVNSRGRTRKELVENLQSALKEALEMNRAAARQSAGKNFEEARISI